MRRGRRRAASGVLALGLALGLTAVAATAAPASAGGTDLPPSTLKALRKQFNRDVKPLGVKISRGMLQDIETYDVDPEGTHLALYVEPRGDDYGSAEYIENFITLTREFIPRVFKKWDGLESFDICQEPADDPRESPPPVTQIFVTRDALDRVGSWQKADLTQLLQASPRVRDIAAGYFVYFSPAVRSDPGFEAAANEAGWTGPTTTTSTGTATATTAPRR